MINLIPNEEKKKKVKDFYFRFTVVFFTTIGFSMIVASTLLLPSYFISSVKKNIINTKLELQKQEPVPTLDSETLKALSDLNEKLNLAEKNNKEKYIVSTHVVNEVILKKMFDIKITRIAYSNAVNIGKIITVNGVAVSRERLLLFRKALEDDPAFSKVNLPISNFIKGSNIQFSLTLTPS